MQTRERLVFSIIRGKKYWSRRSRKLTADLLTHATVPPTIHGRNKTASPFAGRIARPLTDRAVPDRWSATCWYIVADTMEKVYPSSGGIGTLGRNTAPLRVSSAIIPYDWKSIRPSLSFSFILYFSSVYVYPFGFVLPFDAFRYWP